MAKDDEKPAAEPNSETDPAPAPATEKPKPAPAPPQMVADGNPRSVRKGHVRVDEKSKK